MQLLPVGSKLFWTHDRIEKLILAPYRLWLMQFFDAVEGADRHAILSALQEVRASFPAVVKR